MLKHGDTLTYISLFSSAGVGCYGFKMEDFECVATNEIIGRRLDVQKANNKCRFETGYVAGDISTDEVKGKIYAEVDRWAKLGNDRVDVVMATPPCQGISVINHKKNSGEIKRNSLVIESAEIIRRIRPRVFIFENVMAFQKTLCVTREGETLPIGMYIQRCLGEDYIISARVLNFMNYGANSSRTRTLVIGVDKSYRNQFVPYDLFPAYRHEPTLREVIGGFEKLEWGEISATDFYHAFRTYGERMRPWIHDLREGESAFDNVDPDRRPHKMVDGVRIENIKKNRDKYTRQKWDRFVQCVHTRNDQLAAQNTLHPEEDRVFSIRELMEMMTVPREFRWVAVGLRELNALPDNEKRRIYRAHETNIRQCLGEAVPTEIVRQIAAGVKAQFRDKKQSPSQLNRIIEKHSLTECNRLSDFVLNNPLGLSVPSLMRIAELCNAKREENEAFYTNKFIVNDVMNYLPDFGKPSVRILEPSVGVGNFLPFLFKRYATVPHVELDVLDIDSDSVKLLRLLLDKMEIPNNFKINIVCDDFLTHDFDVKYDLVIGNPPFSKLRGDLVRYEVVLSRNVNQATKDIAELFLEKCMSIGGYVALVLNKTLLTTDEYAATRELLRRNRIAAILDFGRYGFTGVSIETMCLMVEPRKSPQKTFVYNMKFNWVATVEQHHITDRKFPYFIIYRDEAFDAVADKMQFGIFTVVRDRQITKRLLKSKPGKGQIRVLKARNITDDGRVVDIDGYDAFMDIEDAKRCAIYKYVGDHSVYLSPNMTYNPRVIENNGDWIPDGSVAVLVPTKGVRLSVEQMAYFATDEFRRFYAVARNHSTQSINIDKNSVFFFGALSHDCKSAEAIS
mgnify:CR=1 FL=1